MIRQESGRRPAARLGGLVSRRPGLVVAVVGVVTLAFVPFLLRLRVEANLGRMLPEDDPGRRTTELVDKEFGGSDLVAVVVEAQDVFAPEVLSVVESLSARLERIPGVTGVQSLVTLRDVRGEGDDIVVARVVDSVPATPEGISELRERVLADSRYRGALVAEDGSATLLLVRLGTGAEAERVVADIEKVAGNVGTVSAPGGRNPGQSRISLAGSPALMKYMRDWMTEDLLRLLPLVALVLMVALFLAFRSWAGVLVPLGSVLVALVWTLGLVSILRQPLTVVLAVLPPVLVSVGSAYGIHVTERWRQKRVLGRPAQEAASRAVAGVGLPVFLAMATTVAGFGSNVFMRIVSIRAFAVFASFGIVLSFVLSLVFVPALLSLVRGGRGRSVGPGNRTESAFARVGALVFRHRAVILVLAVVLALVSVVPALRVRPETDFVSYFKPGSGPTRAQRIVNERFGGAMQFEFVIEGDIQDPVVLSQVESFEGALKRVPHVTHTFSIVDVLRSTNRAFGSGKPEFDRLPATREETAQYLLLLSFSGSDFLADYLTSDSRLARLTARFDCSESGEIGRALGKMKQLMSEHFGPEVKVSVGGMPMAVYALHRGIQQNQFASILVALIAVFVLLSVMFRSLRLGLAGMVPMVLTLLLSFGAMGVMGINIDVVTAMLGSIAVGIGIDYSCHLIARFREERASGAEGQGLARRTLAGVGPAIAANALSVAAGFAVLALSSLTIFQKFGALVAGTMVLSSLGALVVLTAVLACFGTGKSRSDAGKEKQE